MIHVSHWAVPRVRLAAQGAGSQYSVFCNLFVILIRAARKKQAKGRVPQSGEVEKVVL